MVAGLEPAGTAIINADDAYAGYWRGSGRPRGASSPSACTRAADFTASNRSADDRARRVRHALHAEVSARRARDHAEGRRRAQHRQRPWRGRGGERRRRIARGHRGGARGFPRGGRPAAAQGRGCATAGSSTIPTTPIRVRCAPVSRCCARCSGGDVAGAWPTWPSSASTPRTATPTWARYARDCGVKRLFALGSAELARGRDLRLGRRVVRRRRCADPAPAGGSRPRASRC